MKRDVAGILTLAAFMRKLGLSQRSVAMSMGLNESAVSRIMNNKRGIKFVEVIAFCDNNGVAYSEFERCYRKICANKELVSEAECLFNEKDRLKTSLATIKLPVT